MVNFRANFFCLNSTPKTSLSSRLRPFQHLSKPLKPKSKKKNSWIQWTALTSTFHNLKPFGKSSTLKISPTNRIVSGSAPLMATSNRSCTVVETIWKAWISTLALRVFRSFKMIGTSLSNNKREKWITSNKSSMRGILLTLRKKTTKRVISRRKMNFRCWMKSKELIMLTGWRNQLNKAYVNGRQLLHIIRGQKVRKLKHGLIKSWKRFSLNKHSRIMQEKK